MLGFKKLNIQKGFNAFINTIMRKRPKNNPINEETGAIAETQDTSMKDATVFSGSDSLSMSVEGIDSDWLIIDREHTEETTETHALKEGAIEAERLAKVSAYKLAVPTSMNPDSALAAKQDLFEKGYKLEFLGSNELREEKGIYIYAMVKEDSLEPINIVCRGTSNDASLIADLDPRGPGHSAVSAHNDGLMQDINALAKKYPGRKVRLIGHSLGGALAQILSSNMLNERVNACVNATNSAYPELKKITSLETVLFQSACVNEEVISQSLDRAHHMKMIEPDFDISLMAHIKQGDFVSRAGGYIFENIDPEIAHVHMDFRALDKPWFTLNDVLEVGFSAAVSGGAPIPMAISVARVAGNRYFDNRISAHTDFFYHDTDDRTFTKIKPERSQVLSNTNNNERLRISHVLSKNDLKHIPLQGRIFEQSYKTMSGLSSDDVTAIRACAASTLAVISPLMDVASNAVLSPTKGALTAAKHSSRLSQGLQVISEKAPEVVIAASKMRI